jgi:hypothetical protein
MLGVVGFLLLRADEVIGRWRRRWLLTDEDTGAALADHQVAIDPGEAEAEAIVDLYRYLRWNADPDRRVESEATLVEQVGARIGEHGICHPNGVTTLR